MYENKVGVVAVGRVQERWNGVSHTSPWYYTPAEMETLTGGAFEYRIAVDWFLDLSAQPVTVETLMELRGNSGPAPPLWRIPLFADGLEECLPARLRSSVDAVTAGSRPSS